MELSLLEYWSRLPFPPAGDLPDRGIEPESLTSPALAGRFLFCFVLFCFVLTTSATWRRRQWHPTTALLPGKSHGRRSLVGCSPWGREESDTTERLPFHFSLSCIGEGNGNPLQCSCLENPMDRGAWWAAVHGVAEGQTQLSNFTSLYIMTHNKISGCWDQKIL